MKYFLVCFFVSIASIASAQHPCDTDVAPVTDYVIQNQSFTLFWCYEADAKSPNVFKVYRDSTELTVTVVAGTKSNVSGLTDYTAVLTESRLGTFNFKVSAVTTLPATVVGEKPVVLESTSTLLTLKVIGAPKPPTKLQLKGIP